MIPKFALKHVARWGVLRNRETSRPDPQAGESGSERSSETAMARVHSDERVGRMEFQLQLRQRGIMDKSVMRALDEVPREYFVPPDYSAVAYADHALPIACGQTISQPYVVALMTELAAVKPGDRVLEIGTGSGYQAAILCALGAEVYTVEIVEPLARGAEAVLRRLGYGRVHVRHGDGSRGWPEAAPFAAVVVTAAAPEVPAALVAQLAPGGRLVIPVGEGEQELRVLVRTPSGIETRAGVPVQFVPMVVGP